MSCLHLPAWIVIRKMSLTRVHYLHHFNLRFVINKTGRVLFKTQRSFSVPSTKDVKPAEDLETKVLVWKVFSCEGPCCSWFWVLQNRSTRASVSNENNVLLDPDVLVDDHTQILVLTVLATLVKYSTDENELRILYEYLAEAAVEFPKVFPVV